MPAIFHRRHINDTQKPIYAKLRSKDGTGTWVNENLTGKTVKFRMLNEAGDVIVDDRAASIVTATEGTVYYTFQGTEVDTLGTYYGYFVVLDGSSKSNTFPVVKDELVIEIYND